MVEANGKSILRANVDGEYYAIGNICTHKACKLTNGKLSGEIINAPVTAHAST